MYKHSRNQNKHKCLSQVTEMKLDLVKQMRQKQLRGCAVSVSLVQNHQRLFIPARVLAAVPLLVTQGVLPAVTPH